MMVGAFYNPHLAAALLRAESIDHLAMADPPAPHDPHWPAIKRRYTLLLHDYLGQLSEPLDERAMQRARSLAALYDTPWVAEHFQCLHTEDGTYNLNYVFPPLYTEEFLARFVANANALKARLDQPLVLENIPGFFDVKASQMLEPVWLRRFFEATGTGFLLDLPHVWLEAHYRGVAPEAWLAEFPLEHVVELHVAGVEEDGDLQGPWIAPTAPSDEMLGFMAHAAGRCPGV
ncbi:MAG: multinuclear nonheme iron-dependent oxidase, partial [Gemmatimonadales bacterium]